MFNEENIRSMLGRKVHEKMQGKCMEKSTRESEERDVYFSENEGLHMNEENREKTDTFSKETSILSIIISIIMFLISATAYCVLRYHNHKKSKNRINYVCQAESSSTNEQKCLPLCTATDKNHLKYSIDVQKLNPKLDNTEIEKNQHSQKLEASFAPNQNVANATSSPRVQNSMKQITAITTLQNAFHAFNRQERESCSNAVSQPIVAGLTIDDCDASTCSLEYDYESLHYEKSFDSHNSSHNFSELSSEGQCSLSFLTDSCLDSFDSDNLSQLSELDTADELKVSILDSSLDDSSKGAIQRDMKSYLKIFYP